MARVLQSKHMVFSTRYINHQIHEFNYLSNSTPLDITFIVSFMVIAQTVQDTFHTKDSCH